MAGYADIDQVRAMLRAADGVSLASDTEARIASLNEALSRELDAKLNRQPAQATRLLDGPVGAPWAHLVLPVPVLTVTAVAITGTAPEALTSDAYALMRPARFGGYRELWRLDGNVWPWPDGSSFVSITGTWADETFIGTVPAEVVYAASVLVAESFKREQANPAGYTAPDGSTVRPTDPWKHPAVLPVLDRYRVHASVRF